VSETTIRNALREARRIGLVAVEERRITGFRNNTNVVTIVSVEWIGWLRLARRETRVGPVTAVEGATRKPESGITNSVADYATGEELDPAAVAASETEKGCRGQRAASAERFTDRFAGSRMICNSLQG
jgi:hypothetical protein